MQNVHREMNSDSNLRDYFIERIMSPVKEWQKEAQTNKAFYLGEKEFEYVKTLTGDCPVIGLSDDL